MTGTPLRVIVTRPAREAARWVEALNARGIGAVALPLIEIAPLLPGMSTGPLDARPYAALMFVSAAAVDGFFKLNRAAAPAGRAHDAIDLIANARCWATGPGTAQALADAGVPPERIDVPPTSAGRFDSEALWAQVHGQLPAGARVLRVRGSDAAGQPAGRDWLASTLAAAGVAVDTAVVYRRLPPQLGDAARALAVASTRSAGPAWLFSSSEAIACLLAALPGIDWGGARAWATHPRIAQAARAAGFGSVHEVPASLDALVASIESFQ
ncbi:MAG: uroporphyrinogen-III synthase [Variovorax paradoxus]|uniref:Uroporphyrinogen-III synthase n=1 Tax=Variovorax paradoxus TaxID=34073 RepID=A0A2W5QR33_VARPD|nr:MAG: uroporphyrinogen-III synthase [Variovorax paradoxus]